MQELYTLCVTPHLPRDVIGRTEHVSVRSVLQLRTTSGIADSNVRQECVVVPSPIEASNHEDDSIPARVDTQEPPPPIGSVVP